MAKLKNVQKLCEWLRYIVIFTSFSVLAAIFISQVYYGHWIVSFSNPALDTLWADPNTDKTMIYLISSPIIAIVFLSVYWLQRLFGEYSKGEFFTNNNMKCYLWLIWLKIIHFIYSLSLPFIFGFFPEQMGRHEASIALDISSFFTWLLLICIVYVLKMAQEINNENKEFI